MLHMLWVLLIWSIHLSSSFKLGQPFQARRSRIGALGYSRGDFVPARTRSPFHMLCAGHRLRDTRTVHRGYDTALYSATQSQQVYLPAETESSLSKAVVDKLFSQWNGSLDSKNMTLLITPGTRFGRHMYQESGETCGSLAEDVAEEDETSVSKERSIFAVFAGSGRGKTTFLCELTKALNRRDDTVAVGITFNDRWDSRALDVCLILRVGNKKADNDTEALLGVAVRMWSMISDSTFNSSVASFRSAIREVAVGPSYNISDVSTLPRSFAQRLLGQLIVSYVDRQRKLHGKPRVTRFILLVDEIAYGEDAYGVQAGVTGTDGVVRELGLQALITRTIVSSGTALSVPVETLFPPSKGLKGGLVLSALSTKVLGESDRSQRTIVGLPVRGSLDARTIVEEWLPMYASEEWRDIYKKDLMTAHKAELVISTIVELPRVITAVMEHFGKGLSAVSPQNVFDLMDNIGTAMNARLDKIKTLSLPVNIVQRLLSRENVWLSTIKDLITDSLLTNSVMKIPKKGEDIPLVPDTGAWNLWMMADQAGHEYLAPAMWMRDALMLHLANVSETADAGEPLEIITRQAINLRLRVMAAQTTETRTMSLSELLCGGKIHPVHEDASDDFDSYLSTFSGLTFAADGSTEVYLLDEEVGRTLPNSAGIDEYMNKAKNKDYLDAMKIVDETERNDGLAQLRDENRIATIKAFLNETNDIVLSGSEAVLQVSLHPKERADGAWMMRDSVTGKVHVLFVDTKSHHIPSSNSTKPLDRHDALLMQQVAWEVTKGWAQARHWQKVCAVAKQMVADKEIVSEENTLFDALSNGRYYFVYLETGSGGRTVVSTEEAVDAGNTLSLKSSQLSKDPQLPKSAKNKKKSNAKITADVDHAHAVFLETAAVEALVGPFNSVYNVARKLAFARRYPKTDKIAIT